jgi:hypothetical protein
VGQADSGSCPARVLDRADATGPSAGVAGLLSPAVPAPAPLRLASQDPLAEPVTESAPSRLWLGKTPAVLSHRIAELTSRVWCHRAVARGEGWRQPVLRSRHITPLNAIYAGVPTARTIASPGCTTTSWSALSAGALVWQPPRLRAQNNANHRLPHGYPLQKRSGRVSRWMKLS